MRLTSVLVSTAVVMVIAAGVLAVIEKRTQLKNNIQHVEITITQPARPVAIERAAADTSDADHSQVATELEPEKTADELFAEGDKAFAAFEYGDAIEAYRDALARSNQRSPLITPYLVKLGQALHATNDYEQAVKQYRLALANVDRIDGPKSRAETQVLRPLIAVLDDFNGEKDDQAAAMLKRYLAATRFVGKELLADGRADEAAASAVIAQVEADARIAAKAVDPDLKDADIKPACSCDFKQAVDKAAAKYGARSYVVAQLYLKAADVADAEDDPGAEIGVPELRSAMSIIEERFGPTDHRLRWPLKRLIALADEDGDIERSAYLLERLELLVSPE